MQTAVHRGRFLGRPVLPAPRQVRRIVRRVAGAVCVLGLLVGCSCSRSGAERTSVCATIEVANERILVPKGLTFYDLVDEEPLSKEGNAVGAVLAFGGTAGAGRYAPAITYLAQRYRAGPGDRADEIDPPERTPAIVANARDLDAALADGLCDEEG